MIKWLSLANSMKLWAMPYRATQYRQVMVESSDKARSTGEGNGKPLQYSCLEKQYEKTKRIWHQKISPLSWQVSNMLLGKSGEIAPERLKKLGQSGNNGQLWRVSSESNIRCCKEQYFIGTWNLRSMNQHKLDMVKEETERVNINILGISQVKWTGMGKFNSGDHYIYNCR